MNRGYICKSGQESSLASTETSDLQDYPYEERISAIWESRMCLPYHTMDGFPPDALYSIKNNPKNHNR